MPRQRLHPLLRQRKDEVRPAQRQAFRSHLHQPVPEQHIQVPPHRRGRQSQLVGHVVDRGPAATQQLNDPRTSALHASSVPVVGFQFPTPHGRRPAGQPRSASQAPAAKKPETSGNGALHN